MKDLQQPARELRNNMTDPEKRLWYQLLAAKGLGYKFLRQHPVGPFIPDFYSRALKLVIEIDGNSHANQVEYDLERTLYLETKGIHVLRFWNNEVMENLEGVEIRLRETIEQRKRELNL